MGPFNGTLYAINCGNNDTGLVYNKAMLIKAGVKMPWKPKTWAEILQAAGKVKKDDPGVSPLWVAAGVAAGPTNVLQGSGNLIFGTRPRRCSTPRRRSGSSTPPASAQRSSSTRRCTEGLGAPTSQLFRPDAVGRPPLLLKQGKLAIAIGSNWYPTVWVDPKSAAPWAAARSTVGSRRSRPRTARLPGRLDARRLGVRMGARKNPEGAEDFIALASAPENMLNEASGQASCRPTTPSASCRSSSTTHRRSSRVQRLREVRGAAADRPNFPVYARALNTATGEFAQNPNTSLNDALKILKDNVTQQLGPSCVETLK